MSINEKIIAALSPLGYPVSPDLYTGEETTYITFNYSVRGGLFADDLPNYDIYLVQVHLLAPYGVNTVTTRKLIKQKLFAAGFTWPTEIDAASEYQSEKTGQHIVFECQMEEGVESGYLHFTKYKHFFI